MTPSFYGHCILKVCNKIQVCQCKWILRPLDSPDDGRQAGMDDFQSPEGRTKIEDFRVGVKALQPVTETSPMPSANRAQIGSGGVRRPCLLRQDAACTRSKAKQVDSGY